VTDQQGHYEFTGVEAGTYTVRELLLPASRPGAAPAEMGRE
jgi:hypothetical protein